MSYSKSIKYQRIATCLSTLLQNTIYASTVFAAPCIHMGSSLPAQHGLIAVAVVVVIIIL
jgi:hypothetical protein